MLFKTTALAAEYPRLHPELRKLLTQLDEHITGLELAPLTLTHVLRTKAEQEELYWARYHTSGVTEATARELARKRFSWHLCACAADFRASCYSAEHRALLRRWLTAKFQKPGWEILEHDIGRGEHFHVAVCDQAWRRKFEQPESSAGTV